MVFDLGVLRGYVDRDRCVLLLPTLADAQLSMTVPEGQKIPACRLFLSRSTLRALKLISSKPYLNPVVDA